MIFDQLIVRVEGGGRTYCTLATRCVPLDVSHFRDVPVTTKMGTDSQSSDPHTRGGDFVVKRVGMTSGNLKKYQAMNFADPKKYHLEYKLP